MSNDWIAEFLPKLTANGAVSLLSTLKFPPSLKAPDGRLQPNISTGSGKYTHLAWLGVRNSLVKLEMIEEREYPEPGAASWDRPKTWLVLTDKGLEVALYLQAHWDEAIRTIEFRDFCGRNR